MNLFVYGTLKDRELIQSLLKRSLDDPTVATMSKSRTVTSKRGFPVMIPDDISSVEGIVWRGLTVRDFSILDSYEGCDAETPVYQREQRNITIKGRTETVWAYFGTAMFLAQIGQS